MPKLKAINKKLFSLSSGKKKIEVHCISDAKFKNLKFVISIISPEKKEYSISFGAAEFQTVLWQFSIIPNFSLKKEMDLLRIQSGIKNKISKKQVKEVIIAEHPLTKIKFATIKYNKDCWFVAAEIHSGEHEIVKEFKIDDQGKIISFDYPNI